MHFSLPVCLSRVGVSVHNSLLFVCPEDSCYCSSLQNIKFIFPSSLYLHSPSLCSFFVTHFFPSPSSPSLPLPPSPSQADINTPLLDDSNAFYGVTSQYESSDNMTISCSTKVCSFGKQVVEKVEVSGRQFKSITTVISFS